MLGSLAAQGPVFHSPEEQPSETLPAWSRVSSEESSGLGPPCTAACQSFPHHPQEPSASRKSQELPFML